MRWRSLVSTLLMAGASVMLPRLMFQTTGIDSQGLLSMAAQIQSAASGAGLDDQMFSQLKALETASNSAAPGKADVGAAAIKAYKNQKPLTFRKDLLRDSARAHLAYLRHRRQALTWLVMVGIGLVVVIALGAISFLRGPARFILEMAFGLSGRFLMLISLSAAVCFAVSALNPWPILPPEVLAAPVIFMLVSGMFLRILDPNYPLWNTMLESFGAPIVSSLGIMGWVKYKSALRARLAAQGLAL